VSFWDKFKGRIAAIVVLVMVLFAWWERSKRKSAEVKVENAEYEKTDAVLAEKQSVAQAKIDQALREAETKKGMKLSPEEMEEFLRNL
jgi:hypothetical protein